MTAEDFHSALQEATNYSLKGFVLPHLKQQLPSLQRDLSNAARATNQVSSIRFVLGWRKALRGKKFCLFFPPDPNIYRLEGYRRLAVLRYRLELYHAHSR